MTKEQFYQDEICCEVARVYCHRAGLKNLKSKGWAIGSDGKPHDPPLSQKQCDAMIQYFGGVKKAYDFAYDYLSDGCGMAG